jgi:hypothetical protein
MAKLFITFIVFSTIVGCTDSAKSLGSKALIELSKNELEVSPRVIAVENTSVDVNNCNLVKTDLNFKCYEVNGIIHNIGRSIEDAPSGAIARGDRISIDFHVNCTFKVGNTGTLEITFFDKNVSVKKM